MPHPDRHTPVGTLLRSNPERWSGNNLTAVYVVTGPYERDPDIAIRVQRFLHGWTSGTRLPLSDDMELIHECLLLVEDDDA